MDDRDNNEEYEVKRKNGKYLFLTIIAILIILLLLLWVINVKPSSVYREIKRENVVDNVVETQEQNILDNQTTPIKTSNHKPKNNSKPKVEKPQNEVPVPMEEIKSFIITSNDKEWNEDLEIFNNNKYNGKPVIYPNIQGTYYFKMKNNMDFDVNTKITFAEENNGKIPMRYRLYDVSNKENSKKEYAECEKLNIRDIKIPANQEKIFALEWKWQDDGENSNKYGDTTKNITYKLKISVEAEG